MFLLSLIIGIVVFLNVGHAKRGDGAWRSVFEASVSSFSVLAVAVIPVACHQEQRNNVRIVCVLVFVILGILAIAASSSVGWSILIGGGVSALQWAFELLLCTDEFRAECRSMFRKKKNVFLLGIVSKCCLYFCEADDNRKKGETDVENQSLLPNDGAESNNEL